MTPVPWYTRLPLSELEFAILAARTALEDGEAFDTYELESLQEAWDYLNETRDDR